MLTELHKHPFLNGRLVLKGGTALNLFYLDLARLSVDIDLNYIAHIDRETTLRERPEITRAVEQVATGLGYKLQNGVDEHALREWHLNYEIAGTPPCQFLLLETEELFGGKIKAMIDRRHPRDLYDLFRFTKANLKHNPEILRKLAVLSASTMGRDFRSYLMKRFDAIDPKELERHLYPLLRADDRPTVTEMMNAVSPLLASVLDHEREAAYLEAMAAGHYRPELLFPDEAAIVRRIQQHPALLWKADNVLRHLSGSRKNS